MLERQMQVLEQVFDYFNDKKFNSKFTVKPVITIQTAGRKSALGWCTVKPIWVDSEESNYYEINIAAEHLASGLLSVSETLLHEMCHLSNLQDEIKDCNPKTQYHNKNFKLVAEGVGLIVEKDKKYGYGFTSLTDELKEEILKMGIEDVFNISRGGKKTEDKDGSGDDKTKTKKVFKYVCPTCTTDIKSKYSGLEIVCKNCDVSFEEQE